MNLDNNPLRKFYEEIVSFGSEHLFNKSLCFADLMPTFSKKPHSSV